MRSLHGIGACILMAGGLGIPCESRAADCNLNAIADADEIRAGASVDCDQDGVPDDCQLRPEGLGFQQAAELKIPRFPGGVLAGDFDGDSDVDLAAVLPRLTGRSPLVAVFPSNGDGTFSPEVRSEIGMDVLSQTTPAAAADLDGDGSLDLAITPYSDFILVLLNRGNGAFSPAASFPLAGFISGRGPAAADLDRDGDVDLAVMQTWAEPPNQIRVLSNDGRAGFTPGGLFPFVRFSSAIPIAADLNGDGAPDLADANSSSSAVSVSFNDGQAGFGPGRNLPLGDFPMHVVSGDLDGDGDPDLITGDNANVDGVSAGMVSVIRNQGAGNFSASERSLVAAGAFGERPAAGDLDGDGDLDVAMVNSGNASLLWNDGQGKLSAPAHYLVPGGPLPNGAFIADFTGDGRFDLTALVHSRVALLVNEGTRSLGAHRVLMPGSHPGAIVAGDFDRDGRLDLVTGDHYARNPGGAFVSSYTLLRNLGGGEFGVQLTFLPAEATPFGSLVAADLDGDGDLDLAVAAGQVHTILNDGRGGLAWSRTTTLASAGTPGVMTAGDIDGDLDLDLAVALTVAGGLEDQAGILSLLINRGSGRFEPRPLRDRGDVITSLAAADFDADGTADIASATAFKVTVFFGGSAAGLEGSAVIRIGSNPVALTAADLDGDGDPDLASVNNLFSIESGNVSVILNAGGRSFQPPSNYAADGGGTFITAADIERDGDLDLATANGGSETISVLANRGHGTFGPPLTFTAGRLPIAVAAGDLDEDGRVDLAVAGEFRVSLLLNERPAVPSGDADENGFLDGCEPARFHRGDVDADGVLNLTDAIAVLRHLFAGGAGPSCAEAADAQNDGGTNLADAIHLLAYLFQGGRSPADPGPPGRPCGADPDPPGSAADLGCERYAGCP